MKIIATAFLLGLIFSTIGWLFYYQQLQYLLPTPVPKNYKVVLASQVVTTDVALVNPSQFQPTFFHFFNPQCPCSRFNLKHFLSLKNNYHKQVAFYAVVTSEEKAAVKKLLGKIPLCF